METESGKEKSMTAREKTTAKAHRESPDLARMQRMWASERGFCGLTANFFCANVR